jgi:hypothetical protein
LAEDPQVDGGLMGEGVEEVVAAIRAAINHHDYIGPMLQHARHRRA